MLSVDTTPVSTICPTLKVLELLLDLRFLRSFLVSLTTAMVLLSIELPVDETLLVAFDVVVSAVGCGTFSSPPPLPVDMGVRGGP